MSLLGTLPASGQLPPSKSHKARRWHFLATGGSRPGLGVVTILQGRRDADSYGVEVEGGVVLFAKLDDAADVYGVSCTRDGHPARCTCRGFARAKTCKHLDAARELVAAEVIDRRDLVTLPRMPA